jgi:TonB family protein
LKKLILFPLLYCITVLFPTRLLRAADSSRHPHNGKYKEKYANGKLKVKGKYKKDQPVGLWQYWYENGQLSGIRNFDKTGKQHGKTILFDEKGDTTLTAWYKDGQLNGLSKRFKSGKLYEQFSYLNGQMEGEHLKFNSEGKLTLQSNYKAGKLEGAYSEWESGGKQLVYQGQYLEGKRFGNWQMWKENGLPKLKATYDSAERYNGSVLAYNENGNLSSESNYSHGKITKAVRYHDNGKKASEESYVIGPNRSYLNGTVSSWYDNGQLEAECSYVNGQIEGSFKRWNSKGVLIYENFYTHDKDNGIKKIYSSQGHLISSENFKMGIKDGLSITWSEDSSRLETYYRNGRKSDTVISYYKNGRKKSETHYPDTKKDGIYTEWAENGKKIKQEVLKRKPIPTGSDEAEMNSAPYNIPPPPPPPSMPPPPPLLRGKTVQYTDYADESPSFKGGLAAYSKFMQDSMRYPKEAQELNIQGTVVVKLSITKEGKVAKTEVIRTPNDLLSEEAVRLINISSDDGLWLPGKINGRPVNAKEVVIVKFQLKQK